VLLYWFTSSSKISMYFLVEFEENTYFFLHGTVPSFNHTRFFLIFRGVKSYQFLHVFIVELLAFINPYFFRFSFFEYFLQTTVEKYFTPLLYFENACMFTRSAAQI